MKRRELLSASGVLALGSALGGCGGTTSGRSYALRLLNASPDFGAMDLRVDGSLALRDAAFGAATGYANLTSTSPTLALSAAGSTVYAYTTAALSFSRGDDYTVVAHGWANDPALLRVAENEDAAASGQARLRVIHTAEDAGAVDVYLTGDTTSLAQAAPLASAVAAGTVTSFSTVAAGTYRLRVVGSGSPGDLRLDVRGVELPSAGVISLISVPTRGGVLVDGIRMAQKGATATLGAAAARVRVVASVADNARVQVTVGNTSVLDTVRSPAVGGYRILPAGTWPVSVLVEGVAVAAPDAVLAAGGDHTLVVTGTTAAPSVALVGDDNRLPRADSRCKIRLLHAASQLSARSLSLAVNFSALASSVAAGSASEPVEISASSDTLIEVTDPVSLTTVFSVPAVTLVAGAVYTVFMLSGGTAPAGVLRRER